MGLVYTHDDGAAIRATAWLSIAARLTATGARPGAMTSFAAVGAADEFNSGLWLGVKTRKVALTRSM